MKSSWLSRTAPALLLLAGLYGCSNVVDPATGQLHGQAQAGTSPSAQPAEDAAMTAGDPAANAAAQAELDRVKRENQQLKVQQQENQARMDALTKQMAQEREEQRRFREMMATNFDLLEQSVSKSLGDQMQRNQGMQTAQAAQPGKGPAAAKTPAPGPAAVPPPAAEMAPAPAAQPQPAQGPQALEPLPYWDDKTPGAKPAAPAAQTDAKKPGDAKKAADAMTKPADKAAQYAPVDGTKSAQAPAKATSPNTPAANAGPSMQDAAVPLAAAAMMAPAKPATFNDPDLVPPANPRELSASPEAKPLYEKGFVYFAKGDFAESIQIYEDFLKRFPNDAHSDNAQFWIGEAHLQMKQVDKADMAFRQVLRNFAHKSTLEGYKTPDAIYKLGQISLLRNDRPRAEYYFGNAAERFPESTAGQRARKDLDQIRVNTAASAKLSPDT